LVGGSPKLTFHYIMTGIDTTLMKDFPTVYRETNGAVENLRLLCDNEADIGLTHASLEACKGITAIANVSYTTLHIISTRKSGVKKITDIKNNTRVAIGPEGSGTAILAHKLLNFYNINYSLVNVSSFEEEQKLLENGQIDVAFLFGGTPIRFIQELRNKQRYQLVDPICPGAFVRNQFYLVEDSLPQGLYGDNPPFPDHNIRTVSVLTVLVVSPEFGHKRGADRIIEKITRLIFENSHWLVRKHAAIMLSNKDFARSVKAYPLHPGAEHYYSRSDRLITHEFLMLAGYTIMSVAYIVHLLTSIFDYRRRKQSTN